MHWVIIFNVLTEIFGMQEPFYPLFIETHTNLISLEDLNIGEVFHVRSTNREGMHAASRGTYTMQPKS